MKVLTKQNGEPVGYFADRKTAEEWVEQARAASIRQALADGDSYLEYINEDYDSSILYVRNGRYGDYEISWEITEVKEQED